MRILVLGVGNILLSDEGIGVRVVEALEQRYRLPDGVEIWMAAPPEWSCWKRWQTGRI